MEKRSQQILGINLINYFKLKSIIYNMGRTSTCIKNDEWRNCSKCREFKIWDMFYKNKCKDLWYSSTCIRCCSEIKSKWTFERQATENRMEWQRHSNKKPERVVDKMTTSHQYAEEKPYWDTTDMVELWTKPISALFLYIK